MVSEGDDEQVNVVVVYPSGQAHPFARAMCVLNLVHE